MTQFIRAHGADPGPTQRPRLAGAISGALSAVPAVGVLWLSHAVQSVARVLGMTWWLVPGLQVLVFVLAGIIYGGLFRRAADDHRGGWLFGISFGFLVWMLGPATLIDWFTTEPLATGNAALGLFAAHLLWGLVLGILFPQVHRLVHRRLADALTIYGHGVGH